MRRLIFIRRSRELGFSLDQTRALLGLAGEHALSCAEVKSLAEQHIDSIQLKIKDLNRLKRILSDLAARCHGKKVPDCPILDALSAET